MYPTGRCLTDLQQRSVMLARESLATCYDNVPMTDQHVSSRNFLVRTWC